MMPAARLGRLGLGATLMGCALVLAPLSTIVASATGGTTLVDDAFNQPTSSSPVVLQNNGVSFPCLTAGPVPDNSSSTIPNCNLEGAPADGSGALRFTDSKGFEASDVIYSSSFPTADGLDITFDAHMYTPPGGHVGIGAADGISFDLASAPPGPTSLGNAGGSLAYAPGGATGMEDGYLGIGLDEYGNYTSHASDGSGCTDPSWEVPSENEVTVRGPGDKAAGYCALSSTNDPTNPANDAMGTKGAIQLHSDSFSDYNKVEIQIDPTSDTYTVSLTPSFGTDAGNPVTVIDAQPLPTNYYDPVTHTLQSGIPPQLTFAVAASTGAGYDTHEIDNFDAGTISNVPLTTLALSASDDSSGSVGLGDTFNYLFTPGVDPGSATSEDNEISLSDQLPSNQVLTGTPSGSDSDGTWDCSATNRSTGLVDCKLSPSSAIAPGDSFPTLDIPVATTSGTPGQQVTDSATVSSSDSLNPVSNSDKVNLVAGTLPLLDAGIQNSDDGGVPVTSPSFTIAMGATVDANGAAEAAAPEITSTLPTGLDLASVPDGGTDWDCSASSTATGKVDCTFKGPVSAGSPLAAGTGPPTLPAVDVPVRLDPSDKAGKAFTVSETVSSSDASNYWAASTATDHISVSNGGLTQLPPTSDTTTVGQSATYTNKVEMSGGEGTLGYIQSPIGQSAELVFDPSTGDISTNGPLNPGTYAISGVVEDPSGDTGAWSFTLTVIPGTGTIDQSAPTSDTTSTWASGSYSKQLVVTGNAGPVTFHQDATGQSSQLLVSSSGKVTTTGTLGIGTYSISGTDSDGFGDAGTWSFTLKVAHSTIVQTSPHSDTTSTGDSASYTTQIEVSGGTGPITFGDASPGSTGLVFAGGAISTTGALGVGSYTVSGSDSDEAGDTGTWSFTLIVTGGTIVQTSETSDTTTTSKSGSYFNLITVKGNVGPVTFTRGTGQTSDLTFDPGTGAIGTSGQLPVGTYAVSGVDSDPNGDFGTWTFTLTVSLGTIVQISPTSDTTTSVKSSTYTNQIAVTGNDGPVTFLQGGGQGAGAGAGLEFVPATGVVFTSGPLAPGAYSVSGTDSDPAGDTGTWSFTLTVTPGQLVQSSPTSGTTTPEESSSFTTQITVTGNSGPVSFFAGSLPGITSSIRGHQSGGLVFDPSSGSISTTGPLAPGTYSISGTDSDPAGDTGTWAFSLLVISPPSTAPPTTTPPTTTSSPTPSPSPSPTPGPTTTPSPSPTPAPSPSPTPAPSPSPGPAPTPAPSPPPTPSPPPPSPAPTQTTTQAPTVSNPTDSNPSQSNSGSTTVILTSFNSGAPTPGTIRIPGSPSPPPGKVPAPRPPPGLAVTEEPVFAPASGGSPVGPEALGISDSTVVPGQPTLVSGRGCSPGEPVVVTAGGQVVADTTADAQGAFSVKVNPLDLGSGQVTLVATCGSRTFATLLSVVTTSKLSSPEGSAGVFGVFVLLGFVLLRGQFSSNATRRRRRRGAAEILEMERD